MELNDTFAFDNSDVPVGRQICQLVNTLAGRGPTNFKLINLSGHTDAKNVAPIVRRQIAAAVVLQALAQFAGCCPKDACTDGVTITGYSLQLQTEPVITL